jgi:tRNA(fMet)-specific endonuclease VapC
MLDTNIVSELARNPQGSLAVRLAGADPDSIVISIITAAELRYGCAKKASSRLTAQIEAILDVVTVLPIGDPVDAHYADIRTGLERAGTPIGPNDLLIAAHSRAEGAVLVTANDREFARVPGLAVENWLA